MEWPQRESEVGMHGNTKRMVGVPRELFFEAILKFGKSKRRS